jgi:Lrp/AsnC family transcriptional regulator
MDRLDKKLLQIVQVDGALTASELGERIGLSAMPTWRWLRRLTESGVIARTVTLPDKRCAGFSTTAFVMLRTRQREKGWFSHLSKFVKHEPAAVEFHRVSGENDFMLKVALRGDG